MLSQHEQITVSKRNLVTKSSRNFWVGQGAASRNRSFEEMKTQSALSRCLILTLLGLGFAFSAQPVFAQEDIVKSDPSKAAEMEKRLLTNQRRLTFDGLRSGEGYFNPEGNLMVFQSERQADNPFYQIYLMDLETGDTERISPGIGKTTCAWIHPDNNRILFASTQDDPDAKQKQIDELAFRESGKERRYAWDYDEHFDITVYDRKKKTYTNLTKGARGYDAEGSYSPNGELIAFASNRHAYTEELSERDKKLFEVDAAFMMEIYLMDADGGNVRRLTNVPGYDGGPFFSPDGKRICWRRFSENGMTAEIMTMNLDGSDQKQLTKINAMSWAPYYHPSGEYLIFATNRHGFSNFELYMIDADGKSPPVRVSYTDGFDGLPVFSPDGKKLYWTSSREDKNKKGQIHVANWNHENAMKALGVTNDVATADAMNQGKLSGNKTSASFDPRDIMRHVDYLCRPELGGRLTGSPGERKATAYVAAYLESLGVMPGGDNGTWFQEFEYSAGAELGTDNRLTLGEQAYELDKDWRPLSFSKSGKMEPASVVFAGYGLVAPKGEEPDNPQDEYDSYVHLDVKDKWVLAFRFLPEDITPERRQHLNRFGSLRQKAMYARDRGAKGIIFVCGPSSPARKRLVPLARDSRLQGTSIGVLSVSDELAESWFKRSDKSLADHQKQLDSGEPAMGFELADCQIKAEVDVKQMMNTGRNVVGRFVVGDHPSPESIVVCAHIDHLGSGIGGSSLAREDEQGKIHFGADDNASGVAAMLEIAQYMADLKRKGKLDGARRDIVFAAWSGEELGLYGSAHFVAELKKEIAAIRNASHGDSKVGKAKDPNAADPHAADPHAADPHAADPHAADPHAAPPRKDSIYPFVAACVNMDMVGRFEKRLVLQGIGSSSLWSKEIEKRNVPIGLPITLSADTDLPTDATAFYLAGVPILSAFTGSHTDYHTPRDTPEKLNYDKAAEIANLLGLITRSLTLSETRPDYVEHKSKKTQVRGGMQVSLGTIPDYADDKGGVLLSGVRKGTPADKAGIKGGDRIIGLASRKVENIYDYTNIMNGLKVGQEVGIKIRRGEKEMDLKITPASRN